MLKITPGRADLTLDDLSELDKLYIIGCADVGSPVWCRDNYATDRQYMIVLGLLSQSQYSPVEQKRVANRLIIEMLGCREGEIRKELCERRRAAFEKNRDAIKLALIDRDGYECVGCGTQDDIAIDHIVPLSRGGTDHLVNLRFLCRPCNSRKGAILSHDFMAALDKLFAEPPDIAAALDGLGL